MKNNKLIKLLSTALVAFMLLSIAPMNEAVANEMKSSADGVINFIGKAVGNIDFALPEINIKAEAAGVDFKWSEVNKTMIFTGSGAMPDFGKNADNWWEYYYSENATKIVIKGGITSVGQNNFKNFTKLEEVVVEAPVTSINASAFEGCTSLTSIVMPDTVTKIYAYAFKDCVSLKEIVIPDGVTRIYAGIFAGCNLEKLTTPFVGGGPDNTSSDKTDQLGYMFGTTEYENTYSVKSKADKKVYYYIPYSLKSVTVTQKLYKYNFLNCKGIEEIFIADSISATSIPACFAQGCENLKQASISDKINTIGMYAFAECSSLKSVVMPASLKSVMAYSFRNCTSLENVEFPVSDFSVEYASFDNAKFINDSTDEFIIVGDGVLIGYIGNGGAVEVPYGVKRLGGAFYNNTDITEIKLPDSLLYLSEACFYGCTSIEVLVIPDSVQSIEAGALNGLCNLRNLTIPFTGKSRDAKEESTEPLFGYIFGTDSDCLVCSNKSCKADTQQYRKRNSHNYYDYSFSYPCPGNIHTVTVTDNSIPRDAFRGSNVKKVILGDGVTKIGPYSFYGSSLNGIVFNEVITELPDSAFGKCSNLKTVNLTSSIKSINGAFANCTGLTTVNFVEGLESISNGFYGCEYLKTINLPDSLKTIKKNAFGNCKSITEFHFGKGLQEIAPDVFLDSRDEYKSVEAFYVDDENPYLYSYDGVIYSWDGVLVAYPECKKATSFYINKNVKTIYRDTLDQMDITVEFVVDPENKYFTAIDGVLYNKDVTTLIRCPREKTGDYVSPETVDEVEIFAFFGCCGLSRIEFVNGSVYFSVASFQGAEVEELIVPHLDEQLSYYFHNEDYKNGSGWTKINKLKITNQRNEIPDDFIRYVSNLKSVEIDGTYSGIGNNAFLGGVFEEFEIPDSVRVIRDYAFDQSNIKRVYGGNNIRKIGRGAFSNTDLEYFEIPEALETIGSFAFAGVDLTEVVFHDKLVEVGYQVFSNSKIKRAVLSESVAHLSDELFINCFELETVVVGGAVESIGQEVFESCTALETVVIPDSVKEISNEAFLDENEDVVYCNEGSYAQQYAVANDIKYTTLIIDPIENQVYTGNAITPEVKASANNRRLIQGEEYTYSYKDNINAGSAKVIAKGLGDFKHLAATAQFTILPIGVEDIELWNTGSVYDPDGVTPEFYVFSGSKSLVEGQDYVILDKTVLTDAGEYNLAVSFIGNYDGVINATYKISRKAIGKTDIEYGDDVRITYKGVTLEEGKDYIVTKETKDNGDVIINVEGIGNYNGTDSYTKKANNQHKFNWFENLINAIRSLFESLFNISV